MISQANMDLITITIVVLVAGAMGGFVNCILSGELRFFPQIQTIAGTQVYRLGIVGHVVAGAVAAFISWSLYGSDATSALISSNSSQLDAPVRLTLAAAGGALLTGIGGSRVLTAEVDKLLLARAASSAAAANANPQLASDIATASPARALEIAREALHGAN